MKRVWPSALLAGATLALIGLFTPLSGGSSGLSGANLWSTFPASKVLLLLLVLMAVVAGLGLARAWGWVLVLVSALASFFALAGSVFVSSQAGDASLAGAGPTFLFFGAALALVSSFAATIALDPKVLGAATPGGTPRVGAKALVGKAPSTIAAPQAPPSQALERTAGQIEGGEPSSAATLPDTPRCGQHPEALALGACARCGNFFCDDCAATVGSRDEIFCSTCAERLNPWDFGEGVPWEEPSGSLVRRYLKTTTMLITSPREFFQRLPARGYARAVSFLYVTQVLGFALAMLLIWATLRVNDVPTEAANVLQFRGARSLGLAALLAPFWALMSAGLVALHLRIQGIRTHFEVLFRVQAYLELLSLAMVLPLLLLGLAGLDALGGLVALAVTIWILVLWVKGVKETHGVSGGAAFIAILLPMVELALLNHYVLKQVPGLGKMIFAPF